jgi:hypothetical protein
MRLGATTARLKIPAPMRSGLVADGPCGITMNRDTKRIKPKFASVTRARLRTSERDRTARRCNERPTKSRPTSVAAAVPASM